MRLCQVCDKRITFNILSGTLKINLFIIQNKKKKITFSIIYDDCAFFHCRFYGEQKIKKKIHRNSKWNGIVCSICVSDEDFVVNFQ